LHHTQGVNERELPPARAELRRGYDWQAPNAPTLSDNKAARLQDKRGNIMETVLIILAGTAATGFIIAAILRWQDDPFEEQIKDAMRYESNKQKIAKALEK
jgi:hypothetical protein